MLKFELGQTHNGLKIDLVANDNDTIIEQMFADCRHFIYTPEFKFSARYRLLKAIDGYIAPVVNRLARINDISKTFMSVSFDTEKGCSVKREVLLNVPYPMTSNQHRFISRHFDPRFAISRFSNDVRSDKFQDNPMVDDHHSFMQFSSEYVTLMWVSMLNNDVLNDKHFFKWINELL